MSNFIGVNNQKWYSSKAISNLNIIRKTNEEGNFDVRESIYEKNREQLQSQFR